MTNYKNPDDLYDALLKQTKIDRVAKYFKKRGYTDKELTSEKGMNFVHTTIHGKAPSYTTRSGMDYGFNVWNAEEVRHHTKFLEETEYEYGNDKLIDRCNDFIVLPNNWNRKKEDQEQYICCVDVDSKEELYRLYKNGFPVFNTPFTLSRNKQLPHFWIKTDARYERMLGKSYKNKKGEADPREIDFLFDYIYESKRNIVYGADKETDLPHIKYDDLCDYANIYNDGNGYGVVLYGLLREGTKPKKQATRQDPAKFVKDTDIDLNGMRVEPKWETIPYKPLAVLLNGLDPNKHDDMKSWYKITRSLISMIGKNDNPNNILDLAIQFWRRSDKYKREWDLENTNLFLRFLNDGSYKEFKNGPRTAAQYLYDLVEAENVPLWKELCFLGHRAIDKGEFKKLKFGEAVKAFNKRVCYLGGGVNMFAEYNLTTHQYIYMKEVDLVKKYRNLYYKSIKEVFDKATGEKTEKECKAKFIMDWLDSEYRKEYDGGACFKPPPTTPHFDEFNLFTGFNLDKITDFDEEINAMSEEELKEELEFVFTHLKYLSGEDQEEKVFDYQLKYIAHMLKFPHILPRVALVWISVPACGKNQMLNFLSNIMGDQYYYSSASSKEVLGDFNACVRGKVLLNLNEFKDGHRNMESLKEIITEIKLDIREKCKNNMMIENCCRIVISTNLKNPFKLEFMNRRFMVMRCNPITASPEFKKNNYGGKLHKTFSNVRTQKMFLRYCREFVSVHKDHNFEQSIIKTAEYRQLQSRNIPYIIRFCRYWYNKIVETKGDKLYNGKFKRKQLFTLFQTFLEDENEKLTDITETGFINDLEHHLIKKSGDMSYMSANPQAFIALGKTNQKVYTMDTTKTKSYFDLEGIDYIGADTTEFVETDSEDSDSDLETDDDE